MNKQQLYRILDELENDMENALMRHDYESYFNYVHDKAYFEEEYAHLID